MISKLSSIAFLMAALAAACYDAPWSAIAFMWASRRCELWADRETTLEAIASAEEGRWRPR